MDAETSNLLTNGGLVLTGGMLMKLADVGFKAWQSRNQKTEITPDPLHAHITKDPKFVTAGEFNERMKKVDGEFTSVRGEIKDLRADISTGNRAVLQKLDEIDKRSEDRAISLNRRIDPMIEKVAANSEAVEFMKAAAIKASVGGRK